MGRTIITDGVDLSFSLFDTRFPPENSKSDRSSSVWSSCGLKEVGAPSTRKLFDSYFFSSSTSSTTTSTSSDGPLITSSCTASSTASSSSTATTIQPTITRSSNMNYVGMDFGDTVTVGACGISPSGNLSNLVVKRAYLYQSLISYHEKLESMKTPEVYAAENSIINTKSITLNDFLDYIRSWSIASTTLIPFYSKLKHRHINHQRKKKKRAVENMGVDRLLRLGGNHMGCKVDINDTPICFAIGLGDFGTVSGLPSLHTSFKGCFIKKVLIFIYFYHFQLFFLTVRSSVFYLFHDLLF